MLNRRIDYEQVPAQLPVPTHWNMANPAYVDFVTRELYWNFGELTVNVVEGIRAQHNANVEMWSTDMKDRRMIQAPLLVAVPSDSPESRGQCMLMIIYSLETTYCAGITLGRGRHRIALINKRGDLVSCPSHLPTMYIRPAVKDRENPQGTVLNYRVNQRHWLYPNLPKQDELAGRFGDRVKWVPLPEILNMNRDIKNKIRRSGKQVKISKINHRICWSQEPWAVQPLVELPYDKSLLFRKNYGRRDPHNYLPELTEEEEQEQLQEEEEEEIDEEEVEAAAFSKDAEAAVDVWDFNDEDSSYRPQEPHHPRILVPPATPLRRSSRFARANEIEVSPPAGSPRADRDASPIRRPATSAVQPSDMSAIQASLAANSARIDNVEANLQVATQTLLQHSELLGGLHGVVLNIQASTTQLGTNFTEVMRRQDEIIAEMLSLRRQEQGGPSRSNSSSRRRASRHPRRRNL
jgi:hypothetical protein